MKVGIVGSGFVGATAAYAMVMNGVGRQIVLVDKNEARASAEADDIFHAVPFAHSVDVTSGSYEDLKGCRVVIIAAGTNQKPGETRLELLGRNAAIFKAIVPEIIHNAPDSVIVVATNPVDVMTHITAHYAAQHGFPVSRVLGSGTTLDTARFRALLARHVNVAPKNVHSYVIGEHGDSEVLTWSLATIGLVPLEQYCSRRGIPLNDEIRASIDDRVRNAAYHIISGKQATYYGIGSALAKITDTILGDLRAILTVCTPQADVAGVKNVTVAMPHLVGAEGIKDSFELPLSQVEMQALNRSASLIRNIITELESSGQL